MIPCGRDSDKVSQLCSHGQDRLSLIVAVDVGLSLKQRAHHGDTDPFDGIDLWAAFKSLEGIADPKPATPNPN